jgi:site-specific DNA-methyltransferase (cytosine-N4-specific)
VDGSNRDHEAQTIGGSHFTAAPTPYPNAYEYWLYHKYRMFWLGMDPLKVRAKEIGARPHFFRKNGATMHDFERQMTLVFRLLSDEFSRFQTVRAFCRGEFKLSTISLKKAASVHDLIEKI